MRTLIRSLMVVTVGITFGQLARETANEYFFTLVGLILLAAAVPYQLKLKAMTRLPPRWSRALGIVGCVWGAADAVWRVQAFYFPTPSSNRSMAFWLPIYGVCAIPFFTVIAHTFLTAFRAEAEAGRASDTP